MLAFYPHSDSHSHHMKIYFLNFSREAENCVHGPWVA
jgi:hypothetical protein